METATVDDKGTHFAYLDSGAVDGGKYTTLVIVHGHTYHAQTFKKMISLAPKYNMRIVALNRRDYVGSMLFTPAELAALNSTDADAHKAFQADRGLELARFMIWFIEKHDIPKASEDGAEGGLALLGWSAGNITTLAFLRHLDAYPAEVVEALESYFRTQIVYETAYSALGYPLPEGNYHPLLDTTIHENARGVAFGTWVSSYFTHPDLSSRKMSGLQRRIPTHPRRISTNETLHPDEFLSLIDPAPGKRSEQQYYEHIDRETMHDQTYGALFDDEMKRKYLPKVKVGFVYCKETTWSILWGMWELEDEMKRLREEGVKGRDVSITLLESGNHFLHWDEPNRAMMVFSDVIRRPSTM